MDNQSLHVLQVCSSSSWGGMEMLAVKLSQALQSKGHQITFLADSESPIRDALNKAGLNVFSVPRGGYFQFHTIRKIKKWIFQNSVDVVHCHYSKDLWQLAPALKGRYKSIPLILTKHIGTLRPKRDFLHRWIYKRVDAIVAISKIIYINILDTHPVKPEKVKCIYNGIDLDFFYSKRINKHVIREKLGIPVKDRIVGIAGRLNWWKGYREFFDMAASIIKIRDDVWFLVVGGGTVEEENEAREIHHYAASLPINERLIFTGFQEDVRPYLSVMDIFVYPAYAEAFGLVIIEAMAMGLPVIASDCDGIPEIITHQKTGYLVPPRDTRAVRDSVIDLLNHDKQREKFGRAGREQVRQNFSMDKMVEETLVLYKTLIRDNKYDN